MKALRLLTILTACGAFGTTTPAASAAEPAAAQPAAAAPASESAAAKADETSSAAPKATQGEEDEAAGQSRPAARPKAPGKGSPERFVPSEQVRADFDVSFPIDI